MFSFNIFREILEELRIQNKLLAKIAGVDSSELTSLNLKKVNFSDTSITNPISDSDLIEEEDRNIQMAVRQRFEDIEKSGEAISFFEEDEVFDLAFEANEN